MKLVKKILDKFNGLYYPQEYLCFAKGLFYQPLHVYLVTGTHIIKDITNQHLFVGYCPLVLAFSEPGLPATIQLIFSHELLKPNELYERKDALALLELHLIRKQSAGDNSIVYYEGVHGMHHFLPGFNQSINRINNNLYNKKPGNVFLHDNLYKQVQIAYSVPRVISLITVSDGKLFNLFPTDLHGQPDETHYIISLRVGGRACEQVENAGKLVLSQVHADAYKMVYGLGKNHMQDLKPKENFPFSGSLSQQLQWPLPEHALACRELVLADSFVHGIHKILLFRVISVWQTGHEMDTLAHIHNSYATWRHKTGLAGNYLLR